MRTLVLILATTLLIACGNSESNKTPEKKTVRTVQSSYDNGQEKDVKYMIENTNDLQRQEMYFENGQVETQGDFQNGKRHGVWESFFEDGTKRSLNTYNEGKLDGAYKVWFENGQVRIDGTYTMDKPTGIWKYYSKEGELVREDNRDS